MSLTTRDLQAIEVLMDKKLTGLESQLDEKLAKQTKDIAQVINQAMSTIDQRYATKIELKAEVNQLKLAIQ